MYFYVVLCLFALDLCWLICQLILTWIYVFKIWLLLNTVMFVICLLLLGFWVCMFDLALFLCIDLRYFWFGTFVYWLFWLFWFVLGALFSFGFIVWLICDFGLDFLVLESLIGVCVYWLFLSCLVVKVILSLGCWCYAMLLLICFDLVGLLHTD